MERIVRAAGRAYLHCRRGDLPAEGVKHMNCPVHGEPFKGSLFNGASPKWIEELQIKVKCFQLLI